MRMFSRFLSYMALGLATCLGFAGMALAEDVRPSLINSLRLAVSSVGEYGHDVAKYKAEQMYMHGTPSTRLCAGANLTAESNGFRLSAMTSSGVAEGKIGGSIPATYI